MNRTGLFIALAVAVAAGLIFGFFPQLDLGLAHVFYNDASRQFKFSPLGNPEYARRAAMWIAWAFAVPAILAPIAKLIWPRRPLFVRGRAVIFLLSTVTLIALILPNMVFKNNWGRPRPIMTKEFGGSLDFKPWWDPRGNRVNNSSFFSGEAATAFWTYAPAALAPPAFRAAAFAAATIFGLATGIWRMAFGAHYASDVVAAGVAAFLVTWLMHGFVYRWKTAHITDQRIDRSLGDLAIKIRSEKFFWWLAAAVTVLTAIRIVALRFSVVDLFPDEAQYWAWGQRPAFGYFSKPPLIAWILAGAGRLWGDSEMGLRAPAPILYAETALVAYFIARHLYNERVGFWTGLCIAFAPGVVFSSRIISTDVPLLFFWAVALLAYLKLLEAPRVGWSVVLGLALGLGLLAKYAMAYFFLGAVCAGFIDPAARALWRQRAIWLSLFITLVVIAPNLIWNATHGFATFRHTEGNILGSGFKLDPLGSVGFVASQFAICGPILFAVFLSALTRPSRLHLERADWLMMAFALPPLALVTVVAFVIGAKANWAAAAAVPASVVAVALLVRQRQWRWLQVSVAFGIALQMVFGVADAYANRVSLPFLAKPDVYHRTMGWQEMASSVGKIARENNVRTIVADQSAVAASLIYYLRDDHWPILVWPIQSVPANQFELDRPLTSSAPGPLLYVTDLPVGQHLTKYYSTVEIFPIEVATGAQSTRRFFSFKLSDPRRSIAPLASVIH